jgi:hypothetical protein
VNVEITSTTLAIREFPLRVVDSVADCGVVGAADEKFKFLIFK